MFVVKPYIIAFISLLAVLLCSCAKEDVSNLDKIPLNVNISSRVLTGDDIEVQYIRFMVLDNTTDALVYNSGTIEIPPTNQFSIELPKGNYTIYVVANEPEGILHGVSNKASIEAITFNATSEKEQDNVLFCCKRFLLRYNSKNYLKGEASIDNGTEWLDILPLELERAFSKFTLYLRKESALDDAKVKGINILNVPSWSYLVNGKQNYTVQNNISSLPMVDLVTTTIKTKVDSDDLLDPDNYTKIGSIILTERNFPKGSLPLPTLELNYSYSSVLYGDFDLNFKNPIGEGVGYYEDNQYDPPQDGTNNLYRNYHYKLLGTILTTGLIVFDAVIKVWQWWDATETSPGTGIVNAALKQPTAAILNKLTNGKTLYLEGRVKRNLEGIYAWDWSSYSFEGLSSGESLIIDFFFVQFESNTSISLTLPLSGFTYSGDALVGSRITNNGKLIITKQ